MCDWPYLSGPFHVGQTQCVAFPRLASITSQNCASRGYTVSSNASFAEPSRAITSSAQPSSAQQNIATPAYLNWTRKSFAAYRSAWPDQPRSTRLRHVALYITIHGLTAHRSALPATHRFAMPVGCLSSQLFLMSVPAPGALESGHFIEDTRKLFQDMVLSLEDFQFSQSIIQHALSLFIFGEYVYHQSITTSFRFGLPIITQAYKYVGRRLKIR